MKYTLEQLGFSPFFNSYFKPFGQQGFSAGRIAVENKNSYTILSEIGTLQGEVSGKMLFNANSSSDLPKVGDWVVMTVFEQEEKAVILDILPRKTTFSRKAAGKQVNEQIIAANIDLIFIVQSLDANYNLRRLERYLVMAYESGAKPVVILNKADLCLDVAAKENAVTKIARHVPVIVMSAIDNCNLEKLQPFLITGATIAFTGSSGVGKSTIINKLSGKDIQITGDVRETDSKGRHTTTRRELILLNNNVVLIDTPGMREIHVWNADEGIEDTFADIIHLASQCRFSNCSHTNETKCVVIEALRNNSISQEHYNNFLKLQKEVAYIRRLEDKRTYLDNKQKTKKVQKQLNQMIRYKS
jgi:ribosome biogenesis GTPase